MYPDNSNTEIEIDLLDLLYRLLGKWYYLLGSLVLGAVLLGGYAFFLIEPTYEATSKLYVVSSADDTIVDLSDLNMGTSLTRDYEELIMSYPLLDQVIEKLDLSIDYRQLAKLIKLDNPDNTRVLRITATTTNPELSRDIANKVAEVASEYLPETMGTIAPNIAQKAKVPQEKAAPSYFKYTVLGGFLGVLLCCGVLVVCYLLDDTIHNAEEMEKYFGIVPLTSIPDSDIFEEYEEKTEKPQWKKKWKR